MRSGAALALALVGALALAGCGPKLPKGVDEDALTQAVGRAIGSPSTCVLIAEPGGKVLWTGGGYISCARNLPTCEGKTSTAQDVLKASLAGEARFISCDSSATNRVGWAMGPVPAGKGRQASGLRYLAVMEGERALPGIEIQDRVERAFVRAGF
ncbi:hypothetical protein CFHF_20260 [Caulobacter flavus]|uniref:Lipoprotein n=1 Tax=Caulobacter flavus TaxID=1679497 RepID=A0A2N5CP97_9CAUL|nr:hypothetical protein [Caulobacter flavus]AYV48505.1 hypothetical protein C1707_20810 [Caulobacter flavus]PLR08779.1 hypothetical protein CFHF_20260 [Caulobacter flavus]